MPTSEPGHPSGERLRAFALGQADGDEVAAVAAHLNGCASCRTCLDDLTARDPFLCNLREAARPGGRIHEGTAERRRAVLALRRAAPPPGRGLDPGSRIARYRVVRVLGEGGMGTVY
jgi:hypothetical protein